LNIQTATAVQEVAAIIGVGLFVAGVWMIYPPAALISAGLALLAPFIFSLRGK
jgi:hypothetical protein